MRTNLSGRTSVSYFPWLALVFLGFAAGCFSTPSPDISNRICTTEQQCPVGYSCLAPGKPGGCCKPGALACPVPVASDGASVDVSPIDMRVSSEMPIDTGNGDRGGTNPGDAPLIDQSADGAGGSMDANSAGGADGAAGTGGSVDATGAGGSAGAGGATSATGGAIGAGGIPTTGGTVAQGGAGGTPDASLPDAPPDAPIRDVAAEGPPPDAPGTCSADKDCPAQSPLCLANRCAKCSGDSDCVGRIGTPACVATSGLCVACTANSYCAADPSKAFCVTNACVGCNDPGASGCNTRTDGKTTCSTSGTVAGQCVACAPSNTRCSATGVPQLCTGSGVWQDQTACGTNYTCLPATGACSCTKTACSTTSCVDIAGTDANNCGSCGHGCLGGTCSSGKCQPAVVASSAGSGAYVFGVDSTNVYYGANFSNPTGPSSQRAFQASKTGLNGTGSQLAAGSFGVLYLGIIGGNALLLQTMGSYNLYDISSTTTSILTGTSGSPQLVSFKSPAPQYFALYENLNSSQGAITWYTTDNTVVQTFSEFPAAASFNYFTLFAFGDSVYWIRSLFNSSSVLTDSTLYSASVAAPTLKRLTSNLAPEPSWSIIDVNAQSVLLTGPNGLYRVTLPGGDAVNPPQFLTTFASGNVSGATEDSGGVYWLEVDGTVYSCAPPSCGTKKVLSSGQAPYGLLYQDSTALYWATNTPSQVLRLAK